jgi:hypothetical protein
MTGCDIIRLHLAERLRDQRRAGSPWAAYYERLLSEGEYFYGRLPPAKHPPGVRRWVRVSKPRPGLCFLNAASLVNTCNELTGPALTYYEGWAFTGILAVEHAWAVWEGRVIDPTYDALERKFRRERQAPIGVVPYLGCPVPPADLKRIQCEWLERRGVAGPVLGPYWLGLWGTEAPSASAEQADQVIGRLRRMKSTRGPS